MSTAIRPHVWKQRDRRWAVRIPHNDVVLALATIKTALTARDLLGPEDRLDIENHVPFSEEDGYVWQTCDKFPRRIRVTGVKYPGDPVEEGDHVRALDNNRSAHGFTYGSVVRVYSVSGNRIHCRGAWEGRDVLIENYMYPGEWEYTDAPLTNPQLFLDEGYDYPGEFG